MTRSSAPARLRPETPADRAAIHAVESAAFGRAAEADLVDALRASVSPFVSWLAECAGEVVGHVALSPVRVEAADAAPDRTEAAAGGTAPSPPPARSFGALAPLAVAPAWQRRGVGAALVHAGLEAAREVGWDAVFLLGDPAYYARFGFRPAAPRGLRYESAAFDAAFQVIELAPGALDGSRGLVRYPPAFANL